MALRRAVFCAEQGVFVGHVNSRRIRLVTHLDVDRAGVERAAKVLRELL